MNESPPAASTAATGDGRFLDHLGSAADMVGARRFREAEVEVLRGLSIAPSDLRALKLLALVRFKLGRLEEARAVCREIAATLPRDAGIRLKLGLIALKLDRIDESVRELELSARLAPDDLRVWSYLGFAYARRGERARAAAAFRRAGQEDHAQEAERGEVVGPGAGRVVADEQDVGTGPVGGVAQTGDGNGNGHGRATPSGATAVPSTAFDPAFDFSAPAGAREPRTDPDRALLAPRTGAGPVPVSPLVGFAVSRLAPASDQASSYWVGATARLAVAESVDVYVRQDAAVACTGAVTWEDAQRRVRGRATAVRLGTDGRQGGSFLRVAGRGDVFVAAPAGRLVPLALDDDTLYLREDRVLAFEGGLAWESGAVPRSGLRMLQFRGRGLVALAASGEPGAVKVTPDRPVFVSPGALLGWVGAIVALGDAEVAPGAAPGPFAVTCEGEGVVLMDVAPGSDKERP